MKSESSKSDEDPADTGTFNVDREQSEWDLEFGQYLAGIIHELRNPLNGILGAAQLVSEAALDDECAENTRLILASAESMDSILNDLMDFACIKAGVFRTVAKPFSIRLAIENIWRQLASEAHEKGISFVVEFDSNVPEILLADEGRIRQVALNLASNAIKFTPNGGVVIRLEYDKEGFDDRLIITVEDSGLGISPECLDKVFQPFFRGAQSNSTSIGHGLGLWVVGKLVTAMGGTIFMKSVEDVGTLVSVNLPCRPAPEALPRSE